jgi:D-sedoheptulose 7-phosphate isomerase
VDLHAAAVDAFAARERAALALAGDADAVANAGHDMAVRFHLGGKLVVFGNGGASTDAGHIAVEFVHPVVVGKRALPAIALTNDAATVTGLARREGFAETFAHQVRCFADPHDIALGVSPDGNCVNVVRGLAAGRGLGLLTVALVGGAGGLVARADVADHLLVARASDPAVVKEVHVTTYHILWELVQVFLERPGVLAPGGLR